MATVRSVTFQLSAQVTAGYSHADLTILSGLYHEPHSTRLGYQFIR